MGFMRRIILLIQAAPNFDHTLEMAIFDLIQRRFNQILGGIPEVLVVIHVGKKHTKEETKIVVAAMATTPSPSRSGSLARISEINQPRGTAAITPTTNIPSDDMVTPGNGTDQPKSGRFLSGTGS